MVQGALAQYQEEIASFANFPSLFMGLVNDANELEHYDGYLRIVASDGSVVADRLDPLQYQTFIEEKFENWTYLKSPFYKPLGEQAGMYRVGPLARLLVSERCGTPERTASAKNSSPPMARLAPVHSSIIMRGYRNPLCQRAHRDALNEPDILSPRVRAHAEPNQLEGIGVAEAPRGTLIHHYTIDENGLICSANLIIATGHNNLAMNRGVLQVAQHFIKDAHVTDGMLNRLEAVIRAFDPCLSCSTHALGEMPLHVQVLDADGPKSMNAPKAHPLIIGIGNPLRCDDGLGPAVAEQLTRDGDTGCDIQAVHQLTPEWRSRWLPPTSSSWLMPAAKGSQAKYASVPFLPLRRRVP